MASCFPHLFVQAVQGGTGFSAVVVVILRIVAKLTLSGDFDGSFSLLFPPGFFSLSDIRSKDLRLNTMIYFAACLMIDVTCIGLMVYLIRSPFGQYYLLHHLEANHHPHSQEAVDVSTTNIEMISTSSSSPSSSSSSSSSSSTLELPSSFSGKFSLFLDLHKNLWDLIVIICANYAFCLLTYPGLSTFVVSYTFNLGDWMPILMIVRLLFLSFLSSLKRKTLISLELHG